MNGNTVYDSHFNGNEIFVLCLIVFGTAAIWLFPRPFSPLQTIFNLLIGIVFGLVFDHTIAVPPFDLYDIGDESRYQLFDLVSYAMYAPFGYWFIYGHERFNLFRGFTIPYIAAWTALGILLERVGIYIGLFHYKDGYQLVYSVPIYLILQSAHLGLFRLAFSRTRWKRPSA